MTDNLMYPKIMQTGQLKALNEYAISRLGTPIFFMTPELRRPPTEDAFGRLYEIITGLYIIYHDHGIKFLSCFLWFTKDSFPENDKPSVRSHYDNIMKLRSGFCHGYLPDGGYERDFMDSLRYYFKEETNEGLAEILPNMTQKQCEDLINKISRSADDLFQHIKDSIDRVSNDPKLKNAWRRKILSDVMNQNYKLYGNKKSYFDCRILRDIVSAFCKHQEIKPYQDTVRKWIVKMESKIQNGAIKESDELYNTLYNDIHNLYHPVVHQTAPSSADLLLGDFNLP